ncbi:RICIN domain-containing protein [Streptomyces milbemycinicus]|uniref:RICIN domain-containing protein n=1 Tax=Streptomyces milbemycinicus TaxID=476552 RepID=A0ABW8LUI6_9ACTN
METGPDPKAARTAAEFVVAMRQLRSWADLSYRQLERNAEAAGDVLPRATISGALSRDDLPREQLLAAFVKACGGDEETVAVWLAARRRLSIAGSGAASAPTEPGVPASAPASDGADASVAAAEAAPEPDATDATAGQAPTPAPVPVPADAAETRPGGPTPPDPDERSHEISPPAEVTEVLASGERPGPGPGEPTSGSAWRRRYLPTLAVGLSAAVGVLLLAYWPFSGSGGGPEARPGASSGSSGGGSSKDADAPSDASDTSESPDTSETPATKEPVADDTPTTTPTRDASSAKPKPTATGAASKPRLPAAGLTRIHPVSAPGLCLTEGKERKTGRAEIAAQMPCADVPLPRVSLDAVGDGVYRIQWDNPAEGKGLGCLAVDDNAMGSGALLAPRSPCTDADNMKFRLEPSHGGFRLRPVHSGLCIGILPPRTEGAEAIQNTCTGEANQAFRFTAS